MDGHAKELGSLGHFTSGLEQLHEVGLAEELASTVDAPVVGTQPRPALGAPEENAMHVLYTCY